MFPSIALAQDVINRSNKTLEELKVPFVVLVIITYVCSNKTLEELKAIANFPVSCSIALFQ